MNDLDLRHTGSRAYRHPLQISPLVFGLVFLGVVAVWVLYETGAVGGSDTAWLLPAVLVGAGALGVLLAALRPRRAEAGDHAPMGQSYVGWPPAYGSRPTTAYDELMAQVPPPATAPLGDDETARTGGETHQHDTHQHDTRDDTTKREHPDD